MTQRKRFKINRVMITAGQEWINALSGSRTAKKIIACTTERNRKSFAPKSHAQSWSQIKLQPIPPRAVSDSCRTRALTKNCVQAKNPPAKGEQATREENSKWFTHALITFLSFDVKYVNARWWELRSASDEILISPSAQINWSRFWAQDCQPSGMQLVLTITFLF